jgi:3-dehydroquinate dehydratase-1
LLDVEAFHTSGSAKSLIKYAHAHDIPVIASNHDFKLTPPRAEILRRLRFMQDDLGADILKIAVMPQCPADVIELFAATEEMFSRYACKPLITMSMGSLGSISRICGHVFGSAATFACSQNASAPGQMDVREVSAMLDTLGRSAPHQ